MKTKKTRISQVLLAALFSLALFGGKVSAKGNETSVSSYETIEETALEVEDWMLNDEYWDTPETAYFFDETFEEDLAVESWMVDDTLWETASLTPSEAELTVQAWMVDDKVWR